MANQPSPEQMQKRANFLGRSQLHGFVNQLKAGGLSDRNGNHREFTTEEIKFAAAAYPWQMQKRAENAMSIRSAILSARGA